MAVKSSQINATELDFQDIAENIKTYLKGQDKFKDYDFEGSNMSVLIDMLAYAGHIGGLNTNLAASEMFLDSAQLRKNVVSRAKDLGFTPASERASAAKIEIKLSNISNANGSIPTENDMTLPRGHNFSTTFDGVSYNFVNASSVVPQRDNQDFKYSNVEIIQGQYITDSFVFDNQIRNAKFVLSNPRIDRSRLEVSVNSGGSVSKYSLSTEVSTITSSSRVFYAQENEEGFLEIYFGDDVLGKGLSDGDVINATYIAVDDIHADGAKLFSSVDNINGFANHTITTLETANGGAEKESIESIKFKASKSYASQNRLVTLDDYKSKVSEFYPNADAIAIWGGEDNNPPEYGKIFLSLKPVNSNYLSESEKAEVVARLRDLNMLTVRPVIVDAKVIDIVLDVVFKYNPREATVSLGELESAVETAVDNYDSNFLNGFDSIFRYSKFSNAIDSANSAILSSISRVKLKYEQVITKNKSLGYTVNFGNGLYHPHDGHNAMGGGILQTTGFKVSGDSANTQFFDDDG